MVLKFFKGFSFAFAGLMAAVRSEINMKFHLLASALVIFAGCFFKIKAQEWIVLIFCISMVISMELINTSIEKLCDSLHPEQSPKIKYVKDVAAAAVLIVALGAAIIGAIVFIPYCVSLFNS